MATPQALVQALEGEVSVTRNGEVVNIKAGDYLLPGDVVETGTDGRLSLEFPGIEGQTPVSGIMSPSGRMSLGEQPGPLGNQIVVMEDGECFDFTSELTEESAAVEGTADGLAGLFGAELAGGGAALAGAGAVAAGIFSSGGGGGSSSPSAEGGGEGGFLNGGQTPQDVASNVQTFTSKTVEDPSTAPQNAQEFVEVSQETIDALVNGARKPTAPASGEEGSQPDPAAAGESLAQGDVQGAIDNLTGGAVSGGNTDNTGGSAGGNAGGQGGSEGSASAPLTDPSPIEDLANAVADGIDENSGDQDATPLTTPIREGGAALEDAVDTTVGSVVDQLVSGPGLLDEVTDFEGGAAILNEGISALTSQSPEPLPAELQAGLTDLQGAITEGASQLEAATDQVFSQLNLDIAGGDTGVPSADGLVTTLAQTVADITPSDTPSAELNTVLDTVDGALVEVGQAVDGLVGGLLGDASSLKLPQGEGSEALDTLTGGLSGISSDAGSSPINLDDLTGGLG